MLHPFRQKTATPATSSLLCGIKWNASHVEDAMLNASPTPAPFGKGAEAVSRFFKRMGPGQSHAESEKGAALVEFALILPMFLLLVTGMTTFGIAFNQYLELTDATAIGAQYLATERANTTDPCADVSHVIYNAAPFLQSGKLTLTYVLDGVQYGPFTGSGANTCSSASTSSGAAGNLVYGQPAEVIAQFPCVLAVYGTNLFPGCTLTAKVTEIVQ